MKILINGKKSVIETILIENNQGKTLEFEFKWRILGVFSMARADDIVWNFTGKSRWERKFTLFKRVIKESINHPSFLFRSVFGNYVIQLRTLDQSEMPIRICAEEGTQIWVSRASVARGIWPSEIEPKLEYDRFRNPNQFGILVRNVFPAPSESKFSPMIVRNLYPSLPDTSDPYGTIRDVQILHGKLILKENQIVGCEFEQIPHSGGKVTFLATEDGKILSLRAFKSLPEIKSGIFLGSNTSWYHFIAEYLPSIMFFPESTREHSRIVLESSVDKNIVEAVKIVTGLDPITVGNYESLEIGNLHYIHNIEERRKEKSIENLTLMSQLILRNLGLPKVMPSRKIYLMRDDNLFRPLQNQKQVSVFLSGLGFELIYPSKLSFSDQVHFISEAWVIVAESGAALTNLIFCSPETFIVEIQPPEGIPDFWIDFSQNFGIQHFHVVGKRKKLGPKGLASDGYSISLNDLAKTLETIQSG